MKTATSPVFDTTAEFSVSIRSGGQKTCRLRWPTDDEFCDRTRARKTVRRASGRGQGSIEVTNAAEVDAELFDKVRLDTDGPAFDEFEKSKALARLERCEVIESELAGDEFHVTLAVPGGETRHILRVPMQKDVVEYGRQSVRVVDTGRRSQSINVALEPAGALYDKVMVKTEGYGGSVPITHKEAAIQELLQSLREEDETGPL